jgi:hypothetical protein
MGPAWCPIRARIGNTMLTKARYAQLSLSALTAHPACCLAASSWLDVSLLNQLVCTLNDVCAIGGVLLWHALQGTRRRYRRLFQEGEGGANEGSSGCFPDFYSTQDFVDWLQGNYQSMVPAQVPLWFRIAFSTWVCCTDHHFVSYPPPTDIWPEHCVTAIDTRLY